MQDRSHWKFVHSQDNDAEWVPGLREIFEYRDLGIESTINSKFVAHVISALPGRGAEGAWHKHDLDFQMVYVIKGWVIF